MSRAGANLILQAAEIPGELIEYPRNSRFLAPRQAIYQGLSFFVVQVLGPRGLGLVVKAYS